MIKVENIEVFGWEAAIRGMRNPMNSWEKSDSRWYSIGTPGTNPAADNDRCLREKYCIGENDLKLMKNLRKAGTDHRKYLRMINVTMDITAPLYWWKEYDTYKIGTVANSCSTIHKIADKEFTSDDFSHEHLLNMTNNDAGDAIFLNDAPNIRVDADDLMGLIINVLNYYRRRYLKTKDKRYWWQLIQLLPASYNQRRTVQLNYEVLLNMYHARKNHKLDEWVEFCKVIEVLPYFKIICLNNEDIENV
jgi:hypothetical protein